MDETETEDVTKKIISRYEHKRGKQLYIRAPKCLPKNQTELLRLMQKELSPSIVNVHVARQKSAKFCLVDFESNEERNDALKDIKSNIKSGKLAKYLIRIPRTENPEFLNKIAEKKIENVVKRRMKSKLRQLMKKNALRPQSQKTCVLRIGQLPRNYTTMQISRMFPDAIDINLQVKHPFMVAALTFPTPKHALAAYKEDHVVDNLMLTKTFIMDQPTVKQRQRKKRPPLYKKQ